MYCRHVLRWGKPAHAWVHSRALATSTGTDLWSAVNRTNEAAVNRTNEEAGSAEEAEVGRGDGPGGGNWADWKNERNDKYFEMKAEKKRRARPPPRETGRLWYRHADEPKTSPYKEVEIPDKLVEVSQVFESIALDRGDSAPAVPTKLYDHKRRMWLLSRYKSFDMIRMPLHLLVHDDYESLARTEIEQLLRKSPNALSVEDIWEGIQASGKDLGGVASIDDVHKALHTMVREKVADTSWVRNPETERKTKVPGWNLNSSRRLQILVDVQEEFVIARRDLSSLIIKGDERDIKEMESKVETLRGKVEDAEAEFDTGMKFYHRTRAAVAKKVAQDILDGKNPDALKWERLKRFKGFTWTEWWKTKDPRDDIDVENILEYTGRENSTFFHEFLDHDSPIRKTTLYKRRLTPEFQADRRQGVWKPKVPVGKKRPTVAPQLQPQL